MPTSGTFNGWTIVAMPSDPAPRAIEFTDVDTIAANLSPFTGTKQVLDWQAAWLEANITMPPMVDGATARAWMAFLAQLRGQSCVFEIGDPLAALPLGTATGGTVSGADQTGFTLDVDLDGTLGIGDYIQIGHRLYRNLDTAASGASTLNIWPQLRESPDDGATITTHNTTGLFRLKSNARKFSLSEARFYGFSFEIEEAL
jgi:hypothetical protein